MAKKFETILLDEAFEFIEKQNIKARRKIFHNIRRTEQQNDPKLFKKLNDEVWGIQNFICWNSIQAFSILGQR